ncbi:MAG: hypothetical protein K6F88_08625 [Ruminococcus sp.]|nr:hypothetical protein [Ruminococcus sp.]
MAILDLVKNGFTTAVDTVSGITQTIIEKNRLNAQLSRLRALMKSECEMINRAYITLGKKYYDNKVDGKTDSCENEEELFEIIENSKEQIKKLRERYVKLIESQTVEITKSYDVEDLEDITVACSNEDEYDESPFVQEPEKETEDDKNVTDGNEDVTIEEVAEEDSF